MGLHVAKPTLLSWCLFLDLRPERANQWAVKTAPWHMNLFRRRNIVTFSHAMYSQPFAFAQFCSRLIFGIWISDLVNAEAMTKAARTGGQFCCDFKIIKGSLDIFSVFICLNCSAAILPWIIFCGWISLWFLGFRCSFWASWTVFIVQFQQLTSSCYWVKCIAYHVGDCRRTTHFLSQRY